MRILLWTVLIAAAAWSGWWFIGSTAKEKALLTWLEDRRAAGWVASTDSLGVTGFPNRFDTVIRGLELADPAEGWAWRAPELELLALSYQPNHIIAIWPDEQFWSNPETTVRITSSDMRGSVRFVPSTALALDALTIDIADLKLESDEWSAALDSMILATRRSSETPHAHDLAITANNLEMPAFWKSLLDRAGNLPDTFSQAELQTTLAFDADWDRYAVESGNPLLTGFKVDKLRLHWGDLQLDAIGDVSIEPDGTFAGELQLRVRNWQDILQMYVDAGAIGPETAGAIRTGLGVLARLSGDPRTLNAPLTFRDGDARIGPVWIGYAPRLLR